MPVMLAAYILGELALIVEPENPSCIPTVKVELSINDIVLSDPMPAQGLNHTPRNPDRPLSHSGEPP
ncbi:MAG: hypothetical protein GSR85_01465 [Desulfurococcales archaeon]|nr:hypothetical protein [Desulfurococcales archaeon]